MTYCLGYQNTQRIQCVKVGWVFLLLVFCFGGFWVVWLVFFNGKLKAQQSYYIKLHKSELVESVHHLCVNSFLAVLDCSPSVELKW